MREGIMSIGRNIARLRREKGMTQAVLASRVGINREYLGLIERGRRIPPVKLIARIAECLDVKLGELLR
jgi:transcriptional regulator with XRE-family HTH domain